MTRIKQIISNAGQYEYNIHLLAAHIRLLETLLKQHQEENRALRNRSANFDRLRDNFREYRKLHKKLRS